MRLALAFVLALGLFAPALAQTTERRVFADTDYEAYFSNGSFNTTSPTLESVSFNTYALKGGKLMLTYIEAMPRWDRASPYPFVKVKGTYEFRLGKFDRKLNARVYNMPNAEFDSYIGEVWLSRDKRMTISPGDVSVGSMRGYNKSIAIARGQNPEKADAAYRSVVVGDWTLRCAFVDKPAYEVECVIMNLETGYRIVRRYLKQTGLS
jgi:hypothetical protein